MARYINEEACAKAIRDKFNAPLGLVLGILSNIPEAYVVEVGRGEWIVKKRHMDSENSYIDGVYYAGAFCSECDYCIHESLGAYGYPTLKTTNFCPNCGADMRGKKDE